MTEARARRGLLTLAVEQRRWDLAAVCLALGVTQAARALPPRALEELIEVLSGEARPRAAKRRRRR